MDATATDKPEMTTKPLREHEWLKNLLGDWRIESEMAMEPDAPRVRSEGNSHVTSLGGLWAYAENRETMPGLGQSFVSYWAIGYDVTYKEYRGCVIMSASSHLWKYAGGLNAGGTVLTLDCEGPSLTEETGSATYREVIELLDADHRTQTSYMQDANGTWQEFAKARYSRAS